MVWFRVDSTGEEQCEVKAERESHPQPHVRRKMLVLWSLHFGLKRGQAAKVAAAVGQGHVFFVDAAHFVFGTFLTPSVVVCADLRARGLARQRFNVLGARNAIARELIAVANTTVVNTEAMCEQMHKIAAQGLPGPIALVLDNARYQRNAAVQSLAAQRRFLKRRSIYGRYHPTFADFQVAIQQTIDELSTTRADHLATPTNLNFQQFDHVSLMAA